MSAYTLEGLTPFVVQSLNIKTKSFMQAFTRIVSELKQHSHFLMVRHCKYAEVKLWQITRYKMALRTQVLLVTQTAFETMLKHSMLFFLSLFPSHHIFFVAKPIT